MDLLGSRLGVATRRSVVGFILVVGTLRSGVVCAAPSTADRAAAEALFNQALKLMDAGNPQAACPKLEESQKMDPGVGTLLYLADCYRAVGRTASAWATFLQASYEAKDAGQADRQQIAEEQAQALEPLLSKVVLRVAAGDTPGLVISNDGQELGRPLWGSEVPVDPGEHTFQAKAERKKPWSRLMVIPPGPAVTEVSVPVLEDAPVEVVPAPAAEPVLNSSAPAERSSPGDRGSSASTQKTWAWVSIAGGGAALLGGGVFSALALADNGRADDFCRKDDPNACGDQGVDLGKSAEKKAQLATVLSGAGGALAVTGVILLLTAPSESDSAWNLYPALSSAQGSLWVEGTF